MDTELDQKRQRKKAGQMSGYATTSIWVLRGSLLLLIILILILILLTGKLLVWYVKGVFRRQGNINPMTGRKDEGGVVG